MPNMDLDSNEELNFSSQQHPINIPSASSSHLLRIPSDQFLGDRDTYNKLCVPLYQASNNSDWSAAKEILQLNPDLLRSSITENHETALHIAVSAKYTEDGVQFVEHLLNMIETSDLELQNGRGETALFVAAIAGHVEMAKILVAKNRNLLTIPDHEGKMPISVAALYVKPEMVEYLYGHTSITDDLWTNEKRDYLLMKCVEADLFDIALDIVQTCSPQHATSGNVLRILARKPKFFRRMPILQKIFTSLLQAPKAPTAQLQLLRTIWESILKLDKTKVDEIVRGPRDEESPTPGRYPSQMLFIAAEKGNKTFVSELMRKYPDIIHMVNDEGQSIFHIAVLHRQKRIFDLLDDIGSIKNSIIILEDVKGNNLLHLTGKRVVDEGAKDDNVSGYFFTMQEELKWFETVKAILPPVYQEKRNNDGLTPGEVFTSGHSRLLAASEKWLKDFASQLLVVAALIAGITFAAPFAVPGGWNQDTGTPIFMHNPLFTAFIISDATSFLLSSISMVHLIGILTSPCAKRDFLNSLPELMSKCAESMFYAFLSMMLTFVITLFIFNNQKSLWIFGALFVYLFAYCLPFINLPNPEKFLRPMNRYGKKPNPTEKPKTQLSSN